MNLYIGKNHLGDISPVQSIFRLVGSDEDALTFALGFLLAHDHSFCTELVRHLRVAPRQALKSVYSVHLQEVTGSGFGRRDIVIENDRTRIVLEAKIGGAVPTAQQLLQYGAEHKLWNQYKVRGVVALTQGALAAATRQEVQAKLAEWGYDSVTRNGTKSLISSSATSLLMTRRYRGTSLTSSLAISGGITRWAIMMPRSSFKM